MCQSHVETSADLRAEIIFKQGSRLIHETLVRIQFHQINNEESLQG